MTTAPSETVMARLARLHPKLIDLSLGRLERLLARLGHPERRLPPVLHVAGTNGKGSTCAFARAIAEAAGLRTHVYTSPHLVTFHERIRLASHLVTDAALTDALQRAETANGEDPITVFEITTAAALLLFAEAPADLLVLEVGLGGRLDATNVVARPAATAITHVAMDHMDFLGNTLAAIAFEKAGIIKPGVPCATGRQEPAAMAVIAEASRSAGASLLARDEAWTIAPAGAGLRYKDGAGVLDLPLPALPGAHQHDNAGIAIAALRAMGDARITADAVARGLATAVWPARLQRLVAGPLVSPLPEGWELWLDGGHNADAGQMIGAHLAADASAPWHVIVGMKSGKGTEGFLAPIIPHAASLWAVAEPDQHLAQPPEAIIAASGGIARIGPRVADAVAAIAAAGGPPARILICGSLYLAGVVLRENG
ncbi:folylpolyglutamate synthase/dihydrofolate synthase family protein [Elioraea sp.]|uniref:bifunctional folylpolyglutamate synthase/dihydrofolate synthase n=1 Tax=Elioraea sp. TaxID=2185103 RepID=UPI0025C258A2|nr:folylpolyglutamate synthase/dihydrofolate synthase family protein [Elioraea sp.]